MEKKLLKKKKNDEEQVKNQEAHEELKQISQKGIFADLFMIYLLSFLLIFLRKAVIIRSVWLYQAHL